MNANPVFSLLETLSQNQERWRSFTDKQRIGLLKKMYKRAQSLSFDTWGDLTCKLSGHDLATRYGKDQKGFDMLMGANVVISIIKENIAFFSQSKPKYKMVRPSKDGRHYYQVHPVQISDQFKPTRSLRAEVWSLDSLPEDDFGGVCLVLGAGNQPFLAFADVMYQLFVRKRCCFLKHHPLRKEMHDLFSVLFADIIEEGFFGCQFFDVKLTNEVIHHDAITTVHMTGGIHTHDNIVWGEKSAQNKAKNEPVLHKEITSELGCVTPWMICPEGTWSEAQIQRHAGQLALAFCFNDSFNCLSPKVVLLDKNWPQCQEFLDCLRAILAKTPAPSSYYPGAEERYNGFLSAYSDDAVEVIESPEAPKVTDTVSLPWTLVHLDEHNREYAFCNEAFAPILGICLVETGNDVGRFLQTCTAICNDEIWGNLSCTIVIDDKTAKRCHFSLDQAIHDLKYGGIGVNIWTSFLYAFHRCSWGGYPGNPIDNVSSGIGIVNNVYRVPKPEKSVLYCGFEDTNHLTLGFDGRWPFGYTLSRDLVAVLQKPSLANIGKLIWGQTFGS